MNFSSPDASATHTSYSTKPKRRQIAFSSFFYVHGREALSHYHQGSKTTHGIVCAWALKCLRLWRQSKPVGGSLITTCVCNTACRRRPLDVTECLGYSALTSTWRKNPLPRTECFCSLFYHALYILWRTTTRNKLKFIAFVATL